MKHPPPWLFLLSGTPYGVVGAFIGTLMPYYLNQRAGIDLDSIGWYGTLLFVPSVVQFLYAPIVDVGPRRKHWLLLMSAIGGACFIVAFAMPLPEHTMAFLAFGLAANIVSGLVGSCNGGLMAITMPDELRGKASGWYNIGNLSGGGLSATIGIWMVGRRLDSVFVGVTLAVMMVIPSLAVLWIEEPTRTPVPLRQVFRETLGEVGHVLFSKSGLTGIALCLSPVGTAALANYFSGMTTTYSVSPNAVALASGLGTTALTALGAGVGGYLCDRFNRRVMYLTSGALTALCGIVMALSPRTEQTYVVGVMVYALITGFCYSAFTSTVLETIGKAGKSASTQYALFVAAGNAAIAYTGFVDTRFNLNYGVEGVIASDATLNIAGVVILAIAFWRLRSFGKWRHAPGLPDATELSASGSASTAAPPPAIARIKEHDDE